MLAVDGEWTHQNILSFAMQSKVGHRQTCWALTHSHMHYFLISDPIPMLAVSVHFASGHTIN
jgi:hypothetical protein